MDEFTAESLVALITLYGLAWVKELIFTIGHTGATEARSGHEQGPCATEKCSKSQATVFFSDT